MWKALCLGLILVVVVFRNNQVNADCSNPQVFEGCSTACEGNTVDCEDGGDGQEPVCTCCTASGKPALPCSSGGCGCEDGSECSNCSAPDETPFFTCIRQC